MLNRHSLLFAGPETGLFAFPQVYQNWHSCKHQLLKGLKIDGWQMRKGMDLLQPEFAWKKADLQKIIAQSDSFQAFVNQYFTKPLQRNNKRFWIEKTPANAYGFAAFLNHFPDGKVIQTIRNPYDAIASLMARGMNAFIATAYYVYHAAIATSSMEKASYFHLKYEKLVEQPRPTLKALFSFLDLPFEPAIVIAKHEKRAEPSTMSGWKHYETGEVKKSSIGRFWELPLAQRALIKSTFAALRISPFYQKKYGIRFSSGKDLCAVLGYEYLEESSRKYPLSLQKYYWRDRLLRIRHGFGEQFWNYPVWLQ